MLADSIPLASRFLEEANPGGKWSFVEVTNENKVGMLVEGKLDAIQVLLKIQKFEQRDPFGYRGVGGRGRGEGGRA